MKKHLTWLLLPIALVILLALLVHFGKLPANFWQQPLAAKWAMIKALFAGPTPNKPQPGTPPATSPAAGALPGHRLASQK